MSASFRSKPVRRTKWRGIVLLQLIGHAVGRVVTGGEEWAGKRDRWSSLLSRLDPWDAIPPRNSGP
ncbi:hypothetical protein ABT083_31725 [Streptomyces goshikiensis]|uniref:hypothetical protein n=1 Tax=Streptomyces goshikiensis TaxID=1942 RepID=UPI00332C9FF0